MYVLVVYDVDVNRVNKIHKMLKEYLNWIQNSVFEGEISDANFVKMEKRLKRIVNQNVDSVLIFKFKSKYVFDKQVIGQDKNEVTNII